MMSTSFPMAKPVAAEADPVDDVRGGKAYRMDLVKVLAMRAIKQAIAQYDRAKS